MKTLVTVFCKEMRRILTDKRLAVTIFLPGILLYVMYTMMGKFMMSSTGTEVRYFSENTPAELESVFQSTEDMTYTYVDCAGATEEERLAMVQDGRLDLYVKYPENFLSDMMAYDVTSGTPAPQIAVSYNAGDMNSLTAFQQYQTAMNAFESVISNKFDIVAHEGESSEGEITMSYLAGIFPMLIMTLLFASTMNLCSETISGEKERGTIANLLLTPSRREWIVLGKVLALGLVSMMSSLCTFLGVILSLPSLTGMEMEFSMTPLSYVKLFLMILLAVVLFTILMTMISTCAKTVKEAQSLSLPVMLVVVGVSLLGMLNLPEMQGITVSLIPVMNLVQSIKTIFVEKAEPLFLLLSAASTVVYSALGVWLLTRMFNSEKIMFNS